MTPAISLRPKTFAMNIHFYNGYPEMKFSSSLDEILYTRILSFLQTQLHIVFKKKIQQEGSTFLLFEYSGSLLVLMSDPSLGISICPCGFTDYTTEENVSLKQLADTIVIDKNK